MYDTPICDGTRTVVLARARCQECGRAVEVTSLQATYNGYWAATELWRLTREHVEREHR